MSESSSLSDRLIYCIADLHLESGRPETTALLIDFLRGPACRARTLYILGDLFEAWIGDDAADALAERVADALRELADHGVQIFFVHGNRDFLLGEEYCRRAGMRLVHEPVRLSETETATALLHGDILCTDDVDYQRFRNTVRNPAWQARILSRPLWWRRLLGRLARAISRRRNRGKSPDIMDVNPEAVQQCFRDLGIQRLVHGHTHRPAIHRLTVAEQPCERIVLGDWHGERGSVARIEGERAELLVLKRRPDDQIVLEPLSNVTHNPPERTPHPAPQSANWDSRSRCT